ATDPRRGVPSLPWTAVCHVAGHTRRASLVRPTGAGIAHSTAAPKASEAAGPEVDRIVHDRAAMGGTELLGHSRRQLDAHHRLEIGTRVELPGGEHRRTRPTVGVPEPLDRHGLDVRIAAAEPLPEGGVAGVVVDH